MLSYNTTTIPPSSTTTQHRKQRATSEMTEEDRGKNEKQKHVMRETEEGLSRRQCRIGQEGGDNVGEPTIIL